MSDFFTTTGVAVECLPPGSTEVKHKFVNGVKVLDVTTNLIELKVVFGTDIPFKNEALIGVRPGDAVVVAAKFVHAQKWSAEVFNWQGQAFVLVPYETIFGVLSADRAET